ncbi:MAG: 6-carboxytetrahydropterin synthase [Rikenellaceae bacterium]
MKLTLTRRFTFEMAHALEGYDGLCSHIHGHSYKLFITISGTPSIDSQSPKEGMIIDFSDLKRIVNDTVLSHYDHALMLRSSSTELIAAIRKEWDRVIEVDFQPTCENLIVEIYTRLKSALPQSVELSEIRLYETENSYATLRP